MWRTLCYSGVTGLCRSFLEDSQTGSSIFKPFVQLLEHFVSPSEYGVFQCCSETDLMYRRRRNFASGRSYGNLQSAPLQPPLLIERLGLARASWRKTRTSWSWSRRRQYNEKRLPRRPPNTPQSFRNNGTVLSLAGLPL